MIYSAAFSGNISKGIPTKYLTKQQFADLSEEEKMADVLYIVDEPPWTPTTISIQEYDTGSWHVRKYSDGYVEMVYEITTSSLTGYNSYAHLIDPNSIAYPVQLIRRCSISSSIFGRGKVAVFPQLGDDPTPLTYIPNLNIAAAQENLSNFNGFTIDVMITGRWK